jgi:hypothetical protein
VAGAGDWAISRPVENRAKNDAADTANNLRIFSPRSGHCVGPDIRKSQLAILERNAVNVFHKFCEVVEFLRLPASRRYFPGEVPIDLRKTVHRWVWLEKPVARAISEMLEGVNSKSSVARYILSLRTYSPTVQPQDS